MGELEKYIQNLDTSIIQRIKETRIEKGYTQKQIADFLGVSQNVYSKIEAGKAEFGVKRLLAVLKYLEIYDIFGDAGGTENSQEKSLQVINDFDSFISKFERQGSDVSEMKDDMRILKSLMSQILDKLSDNDK